MIALHPKATSHERCGEMKRGTIPRWIWMTIVLWTAFGNTSGSAQKASENVPTATITPTISIYDSAVDARNVVDTENAAVDSSSVEDTENASVSTTSSVSTASSEISESELRKWIEKLRSPRVADRSAAERAILAMGVDVLPHLPSAETLSHPSQRQAIDRIRQQLSAVAITAVTPSGSITLRGKFPVSTILEEVAKQSHNNVVDDPLSQEDRLCEVSFDSATFWEVINTISAMANRQICVNREGNTIELRQKRVLPQTEAGKFLEEEQDIAFVSINGAYCVTLDKMQLQQSWSPPSAPQMLLFFSFIREPRVRILRVALDPNTIEIQTDSDLKDQKSKETPVRKDTNVQTLQRSVADASIMTPFQVSLPSLPRSALQIELLRGKFHVAYCDEPVTLEIADCLNTHERSQKSSQQDVQISIKGIRRESATGVTLILETTWNRSHTMPDSFEIQAVPFTWKLVSDTGESISPETVQVAQSGPFSMQIELGFHLSEKNDQTSNSPSTPTLPIYCLHGSVPKGFQWLDVPFEFRRIPLP